MCIITFSYKEHPRYKLIVVANRDEFYARPTKAAHYWQDYPNVLAGRDLQAMGTWLGLTNDGRFAALTNYREIQKHDPHKKSRGDITTNFLTSSEDPTIYLKSLQKEKDSFNGFNVLVGPVDDLYYYSNEQNEIVKVPPGTHSISNHLLNTPWPKVEKAKQMFHSYIQTVDDIDPEELFQQLADDELAPYEALPDTGLDIEMERQVSSIFIRTKEYGTRSSTVILVSHTNEVTFIERTFNDGSFKSEASFQFQLSTNLN